MPARDSRDYARLRPLDPSWLEQSYDAYPRIEEEFHTALAGSLSPRGPDLLYDLVHAYLLSGA